MVFGFLRKIAKVKIGGEDEGGVVILDFTEKTIKLPNGDVIRRDDIINYDTQTQTLIYKSPSGELRTLKIGGLSGEGTLAKFFEKLARGEKERPEVLYL